MIHHDSSGNCPKCHQLFAKYSGFHPGLREWFHALQNQYEFFHISCAGRGREEQEALFLRKASKARWGQSGHNWGCAIDLFIQKQGVGLYDEKLFNSIIGPRVEAKYGPRLLEWYGEPDAPFPEMAHVEVFSWQTIIPTGQIRLVE